MNTLFANLAITKHARPLILFYHGVVPKAYDRNLQGIHHSVRQFEAQMKFLACYRDVVTLSEVSLSLDRERPIEANQVVVTFDDGFRNNLEFAAEITTKYGIRPTLFVCSDHMHSGEWFPTSVMRFAVFFTKKKALEVNTLGTWFDTSTAKARRTTAQKVLPLLKKLPIEKVRCLIREARSWLTPDEWAHIKRIYSSEHALSWSEVRRLVDLGWEIGSHTKEHMILHDSQSNLEVKRQLKESQQAIKEQLGLCRFFAFPNGERGFISQVAAREVEAAGYSLGLSAAPGTLNPAVDRFLLPRRLAPKSMPHFFLVLNNSHRYDPSHQDWLSTFQHNKGH
jgi:peptidoglycan/xylan/chitin deacetylase (PgdA/CDA1 family)